ncbi:hypothetical protein [Pontibacter chinhatensis]|uniref:Uncharacterized protein n=1 Tax=Pontibacter chinhatensis TaxID=1436961 RepID=A0A1I2X4I7_9BACT|nr:hypothetical protein [Pontibacter chinhatensis]SFH07927.1 hypothetical protein SAMN05421739_105357 [Pontibacter chinhatensis]
MPTLDELKQKWNVEQSDLRVAAPYDAATFNHIIRTRMKKQNNSIFRYFWATFTLHIIVYALLSHVAIRYGVDTDVLLLCLLGFGVTVPFTAIMLKRYKQMAVAKFNRTSEASIYTYVSEQRRRLAGFYTFKKRYDLVLIPLLSAIGVILVFNLYFPGGVTAFLTGAIVTYLLTLLSCFLAIQNENKKYFLRPLQELQAILDDYKSEG